MKRIVSLLLAILMCLSAVSVSAAEMETEATGVVTGKIYFDATGWNNVTQIYCHIWINGGEQFYGWKSPQEKCSQVSGALWEYDLSNLNASSYIKGGLKANEDYCLIFHSDTGIQGYDTTFGVECIGDKASLTGSEVENPVDSEKRGYETVWKKNKKKYGPHLAISSIGNFLGKFLCPHESGKKVIGDWLISYSNSKYCDPVEVLAEALPKFGVKNITTVMNYIMTQDLGISDPNKMKKQLEKAYAAAYGDNFEEKKITKYSHTNKTKRKKVTVNGLNVGTDFHYQLIQVKGKSPVRKKINNKLKKDYRKFLKENWSFVKNTALGDYYGMKDESSYFNPKNYRCSVDSTVTSNNKKPYFSIKRNHYWYMGGVRNVYVSGITFDKHTGKTVNISKFIKGNRKQINDKIIKAVQADWEKDSVRKNYKNNVYNALKNHKPSDYSFYVTPNKVVVCFSCYELGLGNMTNYTVAINRK